MRSLHLPLAHTDLPYVSHAYIHNCHWMGNEFVLVKRCTNSSDVLDLLDLRAPAPATLTESTTATMEAIQTHPGNANQAKNFMSPGSLSFPTGHNELTPPGDAGLKATQNGGPAGSPLAGGNGVAPATPAATPGAQQTGSGLTPTLQ